MQIFVRFWPERLNELGLSKFFLPNYKKNDVTFQTLNILRRHMMEKFIINY